MKRIKLFLTLTLAAIMMFNVMAATSITSVENSVLASKGKGGNFAMEMPENLTTKQQKILQMAYDIAKSDGHKNPEILQGIVYQESKAGGMKMFRVAGQSFGLKTNERYYGVSQLKLSAAKDVLKAYPHLKSLLQTDTDEEIIAYLITDDNFNLQVASKYLMMMPTNWSLDKKVAAYNRGSTGVERVDVANFKYVNEVKRHVDTTIPNLALN